MLTNIATLCSYKKSRNVLQNLRYCFVNITRMLNILLTKFKYNIPTCSLDEYESYTKQSHLTYS